LDESDNINDLAKNLEFTVFESHRPEIMEVRGEKWEMGV
jgi:hypothetical protein